MKSDSSENRTISSNLSATRDRERPRIAPLKNTFSRAVSSALKPTPSSMKGDSRPVTETRPLVGR